MLSASRAFGPTCSRGCGALVPQSLGATREGAGSTRQSTCERERSAQEAAGGPAARAGRKSPLRPGGCFHRGAGLPSLVLFVASGVFCALLGDVSSLRSYQQHHCAGLCEPGCPPGSYTCKGPWQVEDGQIQTCSMALRRDPGQVLGHGVEETAAECQKLGATVQTFVVDCSKREEIYSAADKVKKEIGDVTILVNNAGVITAADFLSTQDHQIERMFEVNILGHMWTTRAFLPVMMNNNYGHIVTVASAAGHFVIPFMVAYCSSKFAAVGFHKALTEELSALGKDGIKTTCLCPVFINTGFVKNPTVRLGKILEIEEVVEALMEGIVTNQKMVFVPSNQSVGLLLERVFPERALNLLRKMTDVKFDAVIGQRSTQ
uniref:Estradiol 17-beta-dehydrogenase 11 n=1 Tax=Corvus moneduloides TaxID=1196302 RepID=A0A8U7NY80_CORMO